VSIGQVNYLSALLHDALACGIRSTCSKPIARPYYTCCSLAATDYFPIRPAVNYASLPLPTGPPGVCRQLGRRRRIHQDFQFYLSSPYMLA